ncbi:6-carboxytetrahydropterin synthase [Hyphomonas sp.]|uniref:6-carboxytetrahydropterin synthase n=1 Tax=Hyphomonas sp. TaxID=87 RepID=UPI00333E8595
MSGLSAEGQVFEISKAVTFEAAHYMGGRPEGHPYRAIHGHSFRLEATVAGTVQPGEQWVEDFAHLTRCLEATAAKLDHRLLNEIDGLDVPTLERLCLWAAADLAPHLPGLARVAIARPSLNERCELVLKRA